MLEAAELFDHIGWKWWKKQEIDRDQCLLELVDIFHFLISYDIIRNAATAQRYIDQYNRSHKFNKRGLDKEYIFERVTQFIEICSAHDEVSSMLFFDMVVSLDFTIEDIVKWYVGKNVLNQFRQANGYKDGTYRKNWGGPVPREDNQILAEILTETPLISADQLKDALSAYYNASWA